MYFHIYFLRNHVNSFIQRLEKWLEEWRGGGRSLATRGLLIFSTSLFADNRRRKIEVEVEAASLECVFGNGSVSQSSGDLHLEEEGMIHQRHDQLEQNNRSNK